MQRLLLLHLRGRGHVRAIAVHAIGNEDLLELHQPDGLLLGSGVPFACDDFLLGVRGDGRARIEPGRRFG